jgi:hypothetical protein
MHTASALAREHAPQSEIVGFYRTQRDRSLRLDAMDLEVVARFFSKSSAVVLLIQTGASRSTNAVLFYFENGKLVRAEPRVAAMEAGGAVLQPPSANKSRTTPWIAPTAALLGAAQRRTPQPASIIPWIATAAALVGVIALGDLTFSKLRQTSGVPASSIELQAERLASDFRITWNRDNAVVRSALSGVLSVEDGSGSREIPLDAAEVQSGSMLYQLSGNRAKVVLSVVAADKSEASGSIILLSNGQVVATQPPTPAPRKPQPGETAAEADRGVSAAAAQEPARRFVTPPGKRTSPVPPTPVLELPEPLLSSAQPGAPLRLGGRSVFSVPSPPPPPSQPASVIVPPVVLSRAPVPVSPLLRNLIAAETLVDVEVAVDRNGTVKSARPVKNPNVNGFVAQTAAASVMRWRFRPAHQDGRPVEGSTVVQLRFVKPAR